MNGHRLTTVTTFTHAHSECSCGYHSDDYPITGSKWSAQQPAVRDWILHRDNAAPIETPEQQTLELEAFFSPSKVHSGSITPRDTSKEVAVVKVGDAL